MKKKYLLFVFIIIITDLMFAQNIYKVSIGSTDNKITIRVTNPSNETMQDVQVNLISSPEWIKFNNQIIIIESIESLSSSNAVFTFSTNGLAKANEEGAISFSIQTTSGQNWQKLFKIQVVLPDKFELFQNYPNPFNPSTVIKFSLAKDNYVTLKIFNILGETIKILVNEEKKAGIHNIKFDAPQLSSGIYFYLIEAGDFKAVHKMMLMK